MKYSNYLKSDHWLKTREGALISAGFQCEECGWDDESHYQLNVHHNTYKNLGNEKPEDLTVLCYRCHMEVHDQESSAIAHAINSA